MISIIDQKLFVSIRIYSEMIIINDYNDYNFSEKIYGYIKIIHFQYLVFFNQKTIMIYYSLYKFK